MIRRNAVAVCLALGLGSPAIAADPFADAMEAYREGDPGHAAVMFRGLAEKGDGMAQFNLALLYRVGQGLPRNDREALYWAWRARLSGIAEARDLIGFVLPDVPENQRQGLAQRLLADLAPGMQTGAPAALLGAAALQTELAEPPNPKEAYFWQALAATLGVPGAGALRDSTAAAMADGQRDTLQEELLQRFTEWCVAHPSPPDACAAAS